MADDSVATLPQAKLAAAMVGFQSQVPVIPKSRTAKAGSFSYAYADIADILNAIREPMSKNKLAVTQLLTGGRDGYTTIRTTIWHESGESLASDLEVKTEGKSAQDTGSLFTYYKRYALGAALGIATEEDDDGKAAGSPTPPAAKVETPKEDVLTRAKQKINEALEANGHSSAPAKKAFILKVLQHSTIDNLIEADLVMDKLEAEASNGA